MASRDNPPLHYALLLFPQFELLDAAGPLEALNALSRLRGFPHAGALRLSLISSSLEPVSTGPVPGSGDGLFNRNVEQKWTPTHTYDSIKDDNIDVLIVPGGYGAGPGAMFGPGGKEPEGVVRLVEFIRDVYPKVKYLLTVCTGAGLAARAGIMDGHQATTNKVAWGGQTPLSTKTHWVANARWVVSDSSKLWTTSGVSAGTDGFLALLEHIYGNGENGKSYADMISDGMEWTRVKDPKDDPFAKQNKVEDVLPQKK